MSYFDSLYNVRLMVADPSQPPPWRRDRWLAIARELDELIEAGEKPAAVRATQLQGPMGKMKPMAFGRIGWNVAGHVGWTLDDAPSVPATRGRSPDVYVCLRNVASSATAQVPPFLLVAVVAAEPFAALARVSVERASMAFGSIARARRQRPWGYAAGMGFSDCIQDLQAHHLFDLKSSVERKRVPQFGNGWDAF